MSSTVRILNPAAGIWKMEMVQGSVPFNSSDRDSRRVFWRDTGVHQNLIHAVHPDPVSGAHCWLQKVKVYKPEPGQKYGDIYVDTNKSFEVYKEWNEWAKQREHHPNGLRRPRWLGRPLSPIESTWKIDGWPAES
jgi:hypothetical protein